MVLVFAGGQRRRQRHSGAMVLGEGVGSILPLSLPPTRLLSIYLLPLLGHRSLGHSSWLLRRVACPP